MGDEDIAVVNYPGDMIMVTRQPWATHLSEDLNVSRRNTAWARLLWMGSRMRPLVGAAELLVTQALSRLEALEDTRTM